MTYYEVEAYNYRVEVVRSHPVFPVAASFRHLWLSKLTIVSAPGLTLTKTSGVSIVFVKHLHRFGSFTKKGVITVQAAISDFEDMYRILRTESPVRFSWAEKKPGTFKVDAYRLYAPDNPVGNHG